MEQVKVRPSTVDEYIARFPKDVRQILNRIREVITKSAPDAEERISYGMPAFFLNGGLVWFGVWKKHISLYPVGPEHPVLREELSAYQGTKGSIHFPLSEPIPYDLIRRIVEVRVGENLAREGPRQMV